MQNYAAKWLVKHSSLENVKACWRMQVRKLRRCITLEELKGHREGALASMPLLTAGRLSVQPVTREQWDFILGMEDKAPPE